MKDGYLATIASCQAFRPARTGIGHRQGREIIAFGCRAAVSDEIGFGKAGLGIVLVCEGANSNGIIQEDF